MSKKPHPFRDVNPKHLDCGDLVDSETGDVLRPATAIEASKSIRQQRKEGRFQGVTPTTYCMDPVLAKVRAPEGTTLEDWRLAVALKLRWERSQK